MKISNQKLKQDVIRVHVIIERIPSTKDYITHGHYGLNTIKRRFGSWNKLLLELFDGVNRKRGRSIEVECTNCHERFSKPENAIVTHNFCSKRCAAKFNNSKKPKRKLTKQCGGCSNLIKKDHTYCPNCIKKGRHLRSGTHLVNRTLKEVLYKRDANKYGTVRCHARGVTANRKQVCEVCGYDKHVEICHILEISEFSLDTKIGHINRPENLTLLCRNCHWESHHGLIDLSGGPARTRTENN